MKIGVVGNRVGWIYSDVERELNKLGCYHSDTIVTGGADGVDDFARRYAKANGNECLILYPKPSIDSPERYYKRNQEIVCRCDILVAFDKQKHSGTSNTIRYAKEMNKKIIEIN